MHELGILYHVVDQVLNIVEENQLETVEAIVLQVGELSTVVPRYLYSCYPATVVGTMLEDTKLEVEILPANALCHNCGKVFNALSNHGTCPFCSAKDHELLSGREFMIKEIRAY
ncbi:MAG: hydrogenase maturation nickel metallochaperone HypA [Clostridiales bacterium]|nr:hydrogenase maturation nickel metallochaperone HypA [Clostridiales bacterium]